MLEKSLKYSFKIKKKQSILAIVCLFALSFFAISKLKIFDSAEAAGEGSRVLTVFEDGKKTAFKTDAKTIREALKEQKIEIAKEDNVEPSLDEELSGADYNVNIYRATPIIVQDGLARIKVLTSSKTSRKIAADADLKLYDEDIISSEISKNILEDGAFSYLKVTRAKLISVELFGKKQQFRTQSKTIGDFLKEKNIKLDENSGTSKSLDAKIENESEFSVWRNGKQTISVEEEVNFETEKILDTEKEVGFKEIKTAGEKGKKTVTYEIETKNGQEISRKAISEVVTQNPKKQIERVGAKNQAIPYTGGGNKDEWLRASGIAEADWGYADWLVKKESGWNPNATNRSSGACGLAQALPCSKVPGNGYDPVNSLQWMNSYVLRRYGSWANAVNHSKTKGWY